MKVDVVILGAGLVGATLASCLKDQNITVALIDEMPPIFSPDREARALALSPPSIQCLQQIDVWSRIVADNGPPCASDILKLHISKQRHFGVTEICASDFHMSALGAVVNADYLNEALYTAVQALPYVKIFCPDEVLDLNRVHDHWEIQLKSGQRLVASLLVGADGAESFLRKHEGIQASVYDHGQTAIVVNVTLAQSHHGAAFERFTNNGSIALLPFGNQRVKCVWIVPSDMAGSLASLEDAALLEHIQKVFGFRLGPFVGLGSRLTYPLRTVRSTSVYAHRLALIGNAANSLHPIAAQGFNLGLRDAASLAEQVSLARHQGKDIGAIEVLCAYAAGRQADYNAILQVTHCLAERRAFQWIGSLATEYCFPLKRKMVEWGTGRTARLPKLCRGVPLFPNSNLRA